MVVLAKNAYDSVRARSTFLDTEIDRMESAAIINAYETSKDLASDADFRLLVESAMNRLEEDITRHPLDYESFVTAGTFSYSVYEQIFRTDAFGSKARGFYEKAMAISPNRSEAYEGTAYLNLLTGNGQKAADIVSRELLKNPGSGRLWYLKAIIDLNFGKTADTVKDLNKALEFNLPISSDKFIAFGRELAKLGDLTKAIELYELVLGRSPVNPDDWLYWKTAATDVLPLYVKSGSLDKAKNAAASLRKYAPQSEKAAIEQFLRNLNL